jgi:hypothetical protein
MTPKILTLKEVAEVLHIKLNYAYKVWKNWRDQGVRVLKTAPNAQPRFYLSDILKMLESSK